MAWDAMTPPPVWFSQSRLEALIVEASRSSVHRALARGMGHDIRGPLQTMMLAGPSSDAWGTEADIRVLRSALGHATGRLSELADLVGTLSTGTESPDSGPISLSDVLPRVVALNRLYRGAASSDLLVGSTTGLPAVHGHRGSLNLALLNLILNARDAVHQIPDPQIRVECVESEGGATGVRISIVDNGVGVPEVDRERIFEPFFTSRPEPHLGMGLPAARLLVAGFGGRVTLEPKDGPGARFVLHLEAWPPVTGDRAPERVRPSEARPASARRP